MTVSTPRMAWVTLLTRIDYLAGALVMGQSFKDVNSAYPFVVFATADLPESARSVLRTAGIAVRDITYLEPECSNKGSLDEHDARFADTWTKLRCFELLEYERVVMVDSDMLVLRNMDELMTLDLPPGWIAASHACTCNPRRLAHYPPDWIPENCAHTHAKLTIPISPAEFTKETHHKLNSGLVVLRPEEDTFRAIVKMVQTDPIVATFGFPDQDLLAHFFRGKYLPLGYQYNALKTLRDCHQFMWKDSDVKNIHYILADKPWVKRPEAGDAFAEVHGWWWSAYDKLAASWGDAPGWDVVEASIREMGLKWKVRLAAAEEAARVEAEKA